MAKGTGGGAKAPKPKRRNTDAAVRFADGFARVAERAGVPIVCLAAGFYFIERYATPEQKQRIIEMYVLGADVSNRWPLFVLAGVFLLVLAAQHRFWINRDQVKQKEIDRLASWKRAHQELEVKALIHDTGALKKRH